MNTTIWKTADQLDSDFYEIEVRADRALDDDEARQLFGLIGYAFRQHFRGEPLGWPQRVDDRTWTAAYDITKSASDDWFFHLDAAIAAAADYAVNGTPARKTNRGGPIGSRLLQGLGPVALRFRFA